MPVARRKSSSHSPRRIGLPWFGAIPSSLAMLADLERTRPVELS
jgi:hypothetical protein